VAPDCSVIICYQHDRAIVDRYPAFHFDPRNSIDRTTLQTSVLGLISFSRLLNKKKPHPLASEGEGTQKLIDILLMLVPKSCDCQAILCFHEYSLQLESREVPALIYDTFLLGQ
jgi:hypothetical protein